MLIEATYPLASEKFWAQKKLYHDAEKKFYEQDSNIINLLASEKFWIQKYKYHDAEKKYYEQDSKNYGTLSLALEIAKARQHIRNSLEKIDAIPPLTSSASVDVIDRLQAVEKEQAVLRKMLLYLEQCFSESSERINTLESRIGL